jgi:CLIP-associating protein 1/2
MSPAETPQRELTTKKSGLTKSTVRPRTTTAGSTHRPSPTTSPSKKASAKTDSGLHRKTPSQDSSRAGFSPGGSPSKNEELTMVVPFTKPPSDSGSTMSFRQRMEQNQAQEDDGFTMVIPDMKIPPAREHTPARERSPMAKRTPGKPLFDRGATGSPAPDTAMGTVNEVKVHEDPFISHEVGTPDEPSARPVLGELPLNETNAEPDISETLRGDTPLMDVHTGITSPHGHVGAPSNGNIANTGEDIVHDRAEVLRNRRLLASGIERIRARTLDAHGFRRLQDLVKAKQNLWGEGNEKFRDLLFVLLEYLEAPNDAIKANALKAQNSKTQVLATIRAMLTIHRKEASQYYSRALCAVLKARQQYENTSHIAADLEKTAEEIVRCGQSSDLLDAVLDLTESIDPDSIANPESPSDHPSRTITTSLSVLAQLLTPQQTTTTRSASPTKSRSPTKSIPRAPPTLDQSQTTRLASTAVRFLNASEPDVRKADLEFCLALHDSLTPEVFWKALGAPSTEGGGSTAGGIREGSLNLITYYLARRGKA